MPRPRRTGRSPKSSPSGGPRLAIDLGASKIATALVDRSGRIVVRGDRVEHRNDGFRRVVSLLVRSAQETLRGYPLGAGPVGVSVAAQVDPETGRVVHAPNLRWRDAPLGETLARALGRPVHVLNDGQAATVAEWTRGAGRGARNLACLSLGTGIGGGFVVDGRLAVGATHSAGEVGHLTIVAGGRRCTCRNRGCLEAYAGGWAIAARAREVQRVRVSRGTTIATRSVDSAREVFAAARRGDVRARELVRATERYLAAGIVGLANALNPERIVMGGGLIVGHPRFVTVTASAVRTRCQPSAAGAKIVAGRFGADAPLIGAALWTWIDGP